MLQYEIVIVGNPTLVPGRLSRKSLEGLTWLTREAGTATRLSSDSGLARLGIVPMRRLELPTNEALLEAAKKGYGIAAMSRAVAGPGLRSGELALVDVRGWDVRNTVHVLRIRDATLTPSAELFETFVRAQIERAQGGARRR